MVFWVVSPCSLADDYIILNGNHLKDYMVINLHDHNHNFQCHEKPQISNDSTSSTPDANKQYGAQGYIVDESFWDKMGIGTVLVSHIHTADVSVNCHCVCRAFHTGNT
jgi:hypothetical protein